MLPGKFQNLQLERNWVKYVRIVLTDLVAERNALSKGWKPRDRLPLKAFLEKTVFGVVVFVWEILQHERDFRRSLVVVVVLPFIFYQRVVTVQIGNDVDVVSFVNILPEFPQLVVHDLHRSGPTSFLFVLYFVGHFRSSVAT